MIESSSSTTQSSSGEVESSSSTTKFSDLQAPATSVAPPLATPPVATTAARHAGTLAAPRKSLAAWRYGWRRSTGAARPSSSSSTTVCC